MGAWEPKPYGDGNTSKFYQRGMNPKTLTELRHQRAVVEFQLALLRNGYDLPGSTVEKKADGWFGQGTEDAVKKFQADHGLTADGAIGPKTSEVMLAEDVQLEARENNVPLSLLRGIVRLESAWDPGAVGANGKDTGLVQLNLGVHPYTIEQAVGVLFSLEWAAKTMSAAYKRWRDTRPYMAWECAVLNHNSPLNARRLAESGEYPTEQARNYVERVGS